MQIRLREQQFSVTKLSVDLKSIILRSTLTDKKHPPAHTPIYKPRNQTLGIEIIHLQSPVKAIFARKRPVFDRKNILTSLTLHF